MTITHIVLFKFKPTITTLEIETVFEMVGSLRSKIPQILTFSWGAYESKEGLNQDFTHGFIMTFASTLARDEYLFHPDHLEVAAYIKPYLASFPEGVIAFDSSFAC